MISASHNFHERPQNTTGVDMYLFVYMYIVVSDE